MSHRFINQKVQSIQPSGIRKFFDIANEIEDVISLGVGEPDFDTPWHVREEGIYTLQKGRTFYTANRGLMELHRAQSCGSIQSCHSGFSHNRGVRGHRPSLAGLSRTWR